MVFKAIYLKNRRYENFEKQGEKQKFSAEVFFFGNWIHDT